MRLIDADELLERMMKTSRYFMVKFDIEESPTIEERRHGRWIKSDDMHGHRCSSCHRPIVFVKYDENDAIKLHSPFCPWCGAEMEESDG